MNLTYGIKIECFMQGSRDYINFKKRLFKNNQNSAELVKKGTITWIKLENSLK